MTDEEYVTVKVPSVQQPPPKKSPDQVFESGTNILLDAIGKSLRMIVDQLPGLARILPQVASQFIPKDTPPVLAQMAVKAITKAYGGILNKVFDTDSTDLRVSDLLDNPTERDLHIIRLHRRSNRELFLDAETAHKNFATNVTKNLVRTIYGTKDGQEEEAIGYTVLHNMAKTSFDDFRDDMGSVYAYASAKGIKIGSQDFSENMTLTAADKALLTNFNYSVVYGQYVRPLILPSAVTNLTGSNAQAARKEQLDRLRGTKEIKAALTLKESEAVDSYINTGKLPEWGENHQQLIRSVAALQKAVNLDNAKNNSDFFTRINLDALYGNITDNSKLKLYDEYGNAVTGNRHITKQLTSDDVTDIAKQYIKANRASWLPGDELKNDSIKAAGGRIAKDYSTYLARIAAGVDNVRQVLGNNASAAESRQFINNIFGFSADKDPQAFLALAKSVRRVGVGVGVTQEDLIGDQESGKKGSMHVMESVMKNLGFRQHEITAAALQLSYRTKDKSSGFYGESDEEYQQDIGNRIMRNRYTGRSRNLAMAKVFWARVNNKDINQLTREDESQFLKDYSGVNWDSYYDVISWKIGTDRRSIGDHGRHLINSELVKVVQDSNAALEAQIDIEKIQNRKATLFKEAQRNTIPQKVERGAVDLMKELGITPDNISRKSIGEWQSEIAKASKYNLNVRNAVESFVIRYGKYLQIFNLPYSDQKVKELRDSEQKLQTNYATGFTGVIQALRSGETDVSKLIAIAAGLDINGAWSDGKAKQLNDKLINDARNAIESGDLDELLKVINRATEEGIFRKVAAKPAAAPNKAAGGKQPGVAVTADTPNKQDVTTVKPTASFVVSPDQETKDNVGKICTKLDNLIATIDAHTQRISELVISPQDKPSGRT